MEATGDAPPAALRRTPLNALHKELGGRMVAFAGFEMPVQFTDGIRQEHQHTRAAAGLFDVSHMGQFLISAEAAALEQLMPGDIAGLAPMRQRYSLLTNQHGGIIDDIMITRLEQGFFMVLNAATQNEVSAGIRDQLGADAVTEMPQQVLLALQGPAAAAVLGDLGAAVATMPFMSALRVQIDTAECLVNRCGYTGEDGFEISLDAGRAEALARRLLADPRVRPVGLGARDTLRLEAGLCLSGTDFDANTTPIELDLQWTIAAKYRDGSTPAAFPGAARILAQLENPPARVRRGFKPDGRVPLRGGLELTTGAGREVGRLTSGTFGPSVNHPVAMGLVERDLATPGTRLTTVIRGKTHDVEIAALPFVPHRFYRG